MLMTIVGVLVGLLILGVIIVGVYISIQGDAVMRLLVKQRTKAVLDKVYADRIDFSLEVPFDNVGKQEGTILDAYMRIYLPQEQYSDVLLRGKVNREGYLREDDYFEAMLVPAGTGGCRLYARRSGFRRAGISGRSAVRRAPVLARMGYALRPERLAEQRRLGLARVGLPV